MHDIDKENYQVKSMIYYMENNKVKERKVTKVMKIKAELEGLEIGEFLCKNQLIIDYWFSGVHRDADYFTTRCFDVAFLNAKKLLPGMKFKTLKGVNH